MFFRLYAKRRPMAEILKIQISLHIVLLYVNITNYRRNRYSKGYPFKYFINEQLKYLRARSIKIFKIQISLHIVLLYVNLPNY